MMNTYIAHVDGKGRAVFAAHRLEKGTVIEKAPVISFPVEDWEHIANTVLSEYCYFWGKDLKSGAVALGHGSLYNHSYHPNAFYERLIGEDAVQFIAHKSIEANEEITINYNRIPNDQTPVWFDVVE